MALVNVGIIGAGWCGGIRARTAAASPLVGDVHIAEIQHDRLTEVAAEVDAVTATADYTLLLANSAIHAVIISATPESTHYPMAKAALEAGKHVLLEKPIGQTLSEADELLNIAETQNLLFTIGYSQRFNAKQAYAHQQMRGGDLGSPVSALVSRHITRELGDKIGSRTRLSLAAMEATHDIDFALWCLEPARPVRVFAQSADGVMRSKHDAPDTTSILITMDNGVVVTIAAGWNLPRNYSNFSTTWIEMIGTDGALFLDATNRDIVRTTAAEGTLYPLSTMPGEQVDHVYAGPMEQETLHFFDCLARSRQPLVTPAQARQVMEVYLAADLSTERDAPVDLPLTTVRTHDAGASMPSHAAPASVS